MSEEGKKTAPPGVAPEREEVGRLQKTFVELVDIAGQLAKKGDELQRHAAEVLPRLSNALEDERETVKKLEARITESERPATCQIGKRVRR